MQIVTVLGKICGKLFSPRSTAYRKLQAFYQTVISVKKFSKRNNITVAVNVTQHCNLNCACCNQFSPLVNEYFYPAETFQKECARLLEIGGRRIGEIGLQGGEPLLHPALTEFFDIARTCFNRHNPSGRISLISNGILLLKQPESFWSSCKKNNVVIVITNYRINLDYKTMERHAKDHGVQLEYIEDTDKIEKTTNRTVLDPSGTQNIRDSFRLCFYANKCINLREGKLYTCPTVQAIHFFNAYFHQNFHVSEKDSIDIYRAKTMNEILEFLCKPIPFCRYCNWKDVQTQIPWHTSKRDISEWV